jgi:hypothetical protein
MKKPQAHISIEGGNFLRLTESLVNFGFGDLPDHVHFSLSWHRDSPLANFHVTREVKDPNDKPQVRIVEIPKSDLKQLQPLIANTVFHAVYEPLAVLYQQNLSRKDFYKKVAFMSFDDVGFIPSIWDKSKVKKGKLRMTEHSLSALETWASQPNVQQHMAKQFLTLPWRFSRGAQNGYLISPSYSGPVIFINGQYFKPRESFKPGNILRDLMGDSLARALMAKTARALRQIQTLNDRQTSTQYSQPLLLNFNMPT